MEMSSRTTDPVQAHILRLHLLLICQMNSVNCTVYNLVEYVRMFVCVQTSGNALFAKWLTPRPPSGVQ